MGAIMIDWSGIFSFWRYLLNLFVAVILPAFTIIALVCISIQLWKRLRGRIK